MRGAPLLAVKRAVRRAECGARLHSEQRRANSEQRGRHGGLRAVFHARPVRPERRTAWHSGRLAARGARTGRRSDAVSQEARRVACAETVMACRENARDDGAWRAGVRRDDHVVRHRIVPAERLARDRPVGGERHVLREVVVHAAIRGVQRAYNHDGVHRDVRRVRAWA